MKFSTIVSATGFAAAAQASTSDVQLYVESSNDEVNGLGVSSIHEGAAINYVILGDGAQTYTYDTDTKWLTLPYTQGLTLGFDYLENIAVFMTGGKKEVGFDQTGYLQVDGSTDGLFACKNINDPYRYSQNSYIVTKSDSVGDCVDVKLKKKDEGDNTDPTVTTGPTAGPTGYHNNTVTTWTTVTDYTTYCPNPTTVTITTCGQDHHCQPHTITVAEPSTVTVTGECVVPTVAPQPPQNPPAPTTEKPENPPAPTTEKPENPPAPTTMKPENPPAPSEKPSDQSTVAAESTPPAVSTNNENAAAKSAAGALAGIAAIAALMI